jgi:phosphoribosylformimino-5-aminoimidazole carboxamide ribotide isomerase
MSFIIPAIDIIDGNCVRLTEGDYSTTTIYDCDPVSVAKQFEHAGAKKLHLVDLDGARKGSPLHLSILEKIACQTNLSIDFSGGLRSRDSIVAAFSAGASQVAIGSAPTKDPDAFCEWISEFGPEKIILSADVRNMRIAVSGWTEQTEISIFSFIQSLTEKVTIRYVIVTDIGKDGLLAGPSFALYKKLTLAFPNIHFIASGGVSIQADIEALKEIHISRVIVGKAFYEGVIPFSTIEEFKC